MGDYQPPPAKSVSPAPTAASSFNVTIDLDSASGSGIQPYWNVVEHNRLVLSFVQGTGTWASATILVKAYVSASDSSPTTLVTVTAEGLTAILDVEKYRLINLEIGTSETSGGSLVDVVGHAYHRPFLRSGGTSAVDSVGDTEVTASEVVVPLGTTSENTDTGLFTVSSNRVTVLEDGVYDVEYRVSVGTESGSGAYGVEAYLKKNGTEVTGTKGYCSIGA